MQKKCCVLLAVGLYWLRKDKGPPGPNGNRRERKTDMQKTINSTVREPKVKMFTCGIRGTDSQIDAAVNDLRDKRARAELGATE